MEKIKIQIISFVSILQIIMAIILYFSFDIDKKETLLFSCIGGWLMVFCLSRLKYNNLNKEKIK